MKDQVTETPAGTQGRLGSLTAGLCLMLTVFWPAPGRPERIELPDMGASAQAVLTPQRENEIGKAFMRQVRRELPVVDDPEVAGYIQTLGTRLASNSGAQGQTFTFFVVADRAINAFAAPGGFIGVNSGLMLDAQSESELSAVVAHEIAHVTQRHIARRFEAMDRMAGPSMAALAASILVAMASPEAGMAAAAAAQAGQAQMQIDFTRRNELEADRVGIHTLAQAGFDPRSMPTFFERLDKATRYYGRPPEFLSTHPVTVNRIADTRGRAEQYPYKQYVDSTAYRLVRAKLRVVTAREPKQALEFFRDSLKTGRYQSETAARYGYALALAEAGRPKQARKVLRKLYQEDPDNVSFRAELARLELSLDNQDEALRLYAEGLDLFPGNKQLVRGHAEALLLVGRPAEARTLLTEYQRHRTLDPAFYKLLARSEEAAGDPVEAHITMAEYYHQMGQLKAAIDQLKRARKRGPKNYHQASRIEAGLDRLKTEQASRKRDG